MTDDADRRVAARTSMQSTLFADHLVRVRDRYDRAMAATGSTP